MVKLSNYAAAFTALAASTNALTTLSASDETVNLIELAVYVHDIKSHMLDYLKMQMANPSQKYPDIIETAVLHNYSNDDFTTLFLDIDGAEVTSMLTGVSWYSTRLLPAIEASLSARGIVIGTPSPSTSSVAVVTSSTAPSTSSAIVPA
ncbi:hypothetical protein NCAS_0B00470 [Naumovozyma castellii]|uniref:Uncharacterized protein n=1 Tax=Naumovozyma castellii TaxID=27288 RepID=G0VB08_NAUCA|nr:hypothetical protein NCAS_0B00470 [Naumovozyma castellii CBS 4309]CCC68131.1 hypothetical protein NCAS_0B00470 [Naumovozyma castellii CBS 4309]